MAGGYQKVKASGEAVRLQDSVTRNNEVLHGPVEGLACQCLFCVENSSCLLTFPCEKLTAFSSACTELFLLKRKMKKTKYFMIRETKIFKMKTRNFAKTSPRVGAYIQNLEALLPFFRICLFLI